ncbi:hypothetical protein LCGC14_1182710 [marine sediment metagenome]|uniref:Uncharacterized protein n=1 Tax=marine sediment metagenome TaxID=412755 RepID=A0A0F9ESU3_9ZZZZ
MSKQLTDNELSAFIPERLVTEWQESRSHPHCKWGAGAVVDFLRELALSRAKLARTLEVLERTEAMLEGCLPHLPPQVFASATTHASAARDAIAQAKGLQHQCSQCDEWSAIVNACRCDPHNLPTAKS